MKYDTKFGFQFNSQTNIPRALAIISNALNTNVEIATTCFICENVLEEDNADATICSACLKNEDAFDLYKMKFAKLMESV